MKIWLKLLICIIIATGFGQGSYSQNQVASVNSTTYVNGLPSISILEAYRLNFGTIMSPTTDVTARVGFNNNLAGTAQFLDTSTASAGLYGIFGSINNTINIQAVDLNTYPDMKYQKIKGRYDGTTFNMFQGQAYLAPPGTGEKLHVAAKLKIAAGVSNGDYSPAFAITVDYD